MCCRYYENKIMAMLQYSFVLIFLVGYSQNNTEPNTSPTTSAATSIIASVCGICSFIFGLLLGGVLTGVILIRCKKEGKKLSPVQTECPHIYEDIKLERGAGIDLHHNDAYGRVMQA